MDDARRLVDGYVEHYNNVCLNSAVGYITPKDLLTGRHADIHTLRGMDIGGRAKTAAGSPAAGCVIRFEATLR